MNDFRDKDDPAAIILSDETYAVVGAAMEVYYTLGTGFSEPVYQQALAFEMGSRQIPFRPQERFQIQYKGNFLEKVYIADFICCEQIIVEIKALNQLSPIDCVAGVELLEGKQETCRLTL